MHFLSPNFFFFLSCQKTQRLVMFKEVLKAKLYTYTYLVLPLLLPYWPVFSGGLKSIGMGLGSGGIPLTNLNQASGELPTRSGSTSSHVHFYSVLFCLMCYFIFCLWCSEWWKPLPCTAGPYLFTIIRNLGSRRVAQVKFSRNLPVLGPIMGLEIVI